MYAPTERKLPASVIAILLIDPGMVDMLLFQNKKIRIIQKPGHDVWACVSLNNAMERECL